MNKNTRKLHDFSFSGKVIGLTKVKNKDGMAVKITLDNGIYLEVTSMEDPVTFDKLCKITEIDRKLKVSIDEE